MTLRIDGGLARWFFCSSWCWLGLKSLGGLTKLEYPKQCRHHFHECHSGGVSWKAGCQLECQMLSFFFSVSPGPSSHTSEVLTLWMCFISSTLDVIIALRIVLALKFFLLGKTGNEKQVYFKPNKSWLGNACSWICLEMNSSLLVYFSLSPWIFLTDSWKKWVGTASHSAWKSPWPKP